MYDEIGFLFGNSGNENFRDRGTKSYFNPGYPQKNIHTPGTKEYNQDIAVSIASKKSLYNDSRYGSGNPPRMKSDLMQVLNWFSAENCDGKNAPKAALIKPFMVSYLKNLGVYPINRMVVLRRFPVGVEVNNNLWETNHAPTQVIVGFLNHMNDDLLAKLSFGETWTSQNKMLHEVIDDILTNDFGLPGFKSIASMPGWSQGFVFGFLRKLQDKDAVFTSFDNMPFGDPNMIKDAATRDGSGEQTNLKSTFSFQFEVEWEQKFIGDIDPGDALFGVERKLSHDTKKQNTDSILREIIFMGTSESKFVVKGDIQPGSVLDLIAKASLPDVNSPKELAAEWLAAIMGIIKALGDVIKDLADNFKESIGASDKAAEETKSKAPNETGEVEDNRTTGQKLKNVTGLGNKEDEDPNTEEKKEERKKENEKVQASQSVKTSDEVNYQKKVLDIISGSEIIQNILIATVYRKRWELHSSIKLMTGGSSAPWHLTIGNPFNPIISIGNMVCEDVTITMGNELSINNLPTEIKATFPLRLGRTLGAQEIYNIFNHSYVRTYNENVTSKIKNTVVVTNGGSNGAKSNLGTLKITSGQLKDGFITFKTTGEDSQITKIDINGKSFVAYKENGQYVVDFSKNSLNEGSKFTFTATSEKGQNATSDPIVYTSAANGIKAAKPKSKGNEGYSNETFAGVYR